MELVIDASIVFTAILGEGVTKDLIFLENLDLYVPEFFFTELKEHIRRLKEISKLSTDDFNEALNKIKSKIIVISKKNFNNFIEKAKKISVDENDAPYFALSLSKSKIPIWSNDHHFKKQQEIEIYTTIELVEYLKSIGSF